MQPNQKPCPVQIVQCLTRLALAMCVLLCCALPVYANPTSPEPSFGWVEVRCDPVPEDFSATATVVLSNTQTGEMYTVTCHKINHYIGRLQLPAGKYQVEQTTTADNFAYEALTSTISFDITADMPAAQLITLEIIKHDAVFTVPDVQKAPDEVQDTPDGTEPSQPSEYPTDATASESGANHNLTDNDVLDLIDKESRPNTTEPQTKAPATQSSDSTLLSTLARSLTVVLGSGLFVAFVFGMVYIIRQRSDD